jgi:hypothetical protein
MVFIAMRILAQTSLKTELWLKSYKSLKFQGLDCKIIGARFQILLENG